MRKVVMILIVFFVASGLLYAEEHEEGPSYEEGRTYLGIMLDMEPLPEILTKHLDLESGQGVRIQNIAHGSPADQAGLEQDDIVIQFGDMEIRHGQELVEAVRNSEVGQEVVLLVIHLGERKTMLLKLGQLEGEVEWKYPTEPEFMQSWRPGRMFRRQPDAEEWEEFDVTMPRFETELGEGLREHYFFRHDEVSMTVTIEGNPHDEDSMVIIKPPDKEIE
ncbi:MAG: PDZ domain-containing protein, partial [Planctomycetota bacterium]